MLDLNSLVAAVHDPDVDLSRISFLLPQEVVDSVLDIVAQTRGGESLGCKPILLSLRALLQVAVITDVTGGKNTKCYGIL